MTSANSQLKSILSTISLEGSSCAAVGQGDDIVGSCRNALNVDLHAPIPEGR